MRKNSIIYCRVSTSKQSQEGESLELQEEICKKIAEKKDANVLGIWKDSFSGRKESRPAINEMFDFVKKSKQKIDYLIIRDIDRLTRGGSSQYQNIKDALGEYGIEIIDSCGMIQPMTNTLEYFGFEYPWSKFSQSEMAEKLKSDMSNGEVRTILTRLIGAEIRLTQEGYQIGTPNDGYINKKIYVDGKKKTIQVPDPTRARYYQEMFNLKASGLYEDTEIVDKLNAQGFKTKIKNRWDRIHENVIGKTGGIPLSVKQLQRVIQKPIYCGIICEKWTKYLPVKAQYEGLVSIEAFNKANNGRVYIREHVDGTIEILYNYHPTKIIQRRKKNNPLFPFKSMVLCPKCGKPFLGSVSRGKSGKGFPLYHCARGHKQYGVNKTKFEDTIKDFVLKLRFKPEFLEKLEKVLIKTWRIKQSEVLQTSKDINNNLRNLESMKKKAIDKLIENDNPVVRKGLEEKIEEFEKQINKVKTERNEFELKENDIQAFIKYVKHLMEHLEDLLLDSKNMPTQQALFGLIFDETPTYEEILNGTPKLTLVFELSEQFKQRENLLVALRRIELLFSG